MSNATMRKLLATGRAVAVEEWPGSRYVKVLDLWILGEGLGDAVDVSLSRKLFLELERERWVESVGMRHDDGLVLAAFDDRFVSHADFDCIYEKEQI